MGRALPLAVATVAALALLAYAWWKGSWGALALLAVAAAAWAWVWTQVRRGADADTFFDGVGEETRLTGFQGGSPSEMPAERMPAAPTAPARGDERVH